MQKQTVTSRTIPPDPIRILDAPDISHDYYLNLLDWSKHTGLMAVCLGNTVYLWNEETAGIQELMSCNED